MITNREKRYQQKRIKRAEVKRKHKLAKQAKKFKSNFPSPKKAKPTFVAMQKDARQVIADLRAVNHQLTGKIAKLNAQLGIAA